MKLITIFPLLTFLLICSAESSEITNKSQGWSSYSHASYRFSFQYPETLTVNTRSLDFFHIEGLVLCLELVDKNNPNRIALRLMVSEPLNNPLAVRKDAAFLRKVCKKYKEYTIGGRKAVNCVTCGSGKDSCSWKIVFPGAQQLDIFTMLTDEREQTEPRDRTYPLHTIIRSLKFTE